MITIKSRNHASYCPIKYKIIKADGGAFNEDELDLNGSKLEASTDE